MIHASCPFNKHSPFLGTATKMLHFIATSAPASFLWHCLHGTSLLHKTLEIFGGMTMFSLVFLKINE